MEEEVEWEEEWEAEQEEWDEEEEEEDLGSYKTNYTIRTSKSLSSIISSLSCDNFDSYRIYGSIGIILDDSFVRPYKYLFNLEKAKCFDSVDLDNPEEELDFSEENYEQSKINYNKYLNSRLK